MRQRDKLYKTYKKMKTMAAKIEYDCYNKTLHEVTKRVKAEYYAKQLQAANNDSRKVWAVINSILRGKGRGDGLKTEVVGLSLDEVNSYFAEVGKRLVSETVGHVDHLVSLPRAGLHSLRAFVLPDLDTVQTTLRSLRNEKAAGYDGVPSRLFKESYDIMAAPIRALMRKMLEYSYYPAQLKLASLRPIHKAGPLSDISNYRPISLLSTTNKIIEKILARQSRSYLEDNGLLS